MSRYPEIAGTDSWIFDAGKNRCGESIRKTGDEDLSKDITEIIQEAIYFEMASNVHI